MNSFATRQAPQSQDDFSPFAPDPQFWSSVPLDEEEFRLDTMDSDFASLRTGAQRHMLPDTYLVGDVFDSAAIAFETDPAMDLGTSQRPDLAKPLLQYYLDRDIVDFGGEGSVRRPHSSYQLAPPSSSGTASHVVPDENGATSLSTADILMKAAREVADIKTILSVSDRPVPPKKMRDCALKRLENLEGFLNGDFEALGNGTDTIFDVETEQVTELLPGQACGSCRDNGNTCKIVGEYDAWLRSRTHGEDRTRKRRPHACLTCKLAKRRCDDAASRADPVPDSGMSQEAR